MDYGKISHSHVDLDNPTYWLSTLDEFHPTSFQCIASIWTSAIPYKECNIHNTIEISALMSRLFDFQIVSLAEYDCFSQVVFRNVEDYRRMKEDPWYENHLVGDYERFANTKKSRMTISQITEFIRDAEVVDGFNG